MRITQLYTNPILKIPSINVAPGGRRTEYRDIPVLYGRVTGLPSEINGLLVTSDLQGFEPNALEKPETKRQLLGHVVVNALESQLVPNGHLPSADQLVTLLCGDFYAIPALNKRGGLGDVDPIWRDFKRLSQAVIGVAGNHDQFGGALLLDNFFEPHEAITGLEAATTQLHQLTIGGISGVMNLKTNSAWRHTPATFLRNIKQVLAQWPDILLMHEPPSLGLSRGHGNLIIRECLQRVDHEMIVFCGHRHWDQPLMQLSDQVQVLNCDSRVVILTAA